MIGVSVLNDYFVAGSSMAEKQRNYQRGSTFRILPIAHVTDENFASTLCPVRFFITRRYLSLLSCFSDDPDKVKLEHSETSKDHQLWNIMNSQQ